MHATLYRVRGQPQCMPNPISNRRERWETPYVAELARSLLYKKETSLPEELCSTNWALGEEENIVLRTHEWKASRFSSSSPAPNKGDFFLTSRFEHLHDKDTFESWITKSGWRKVWLNLMKIQKLKFEKHGSIRNLFWSSPGPHEVQEQRSSMILKSTCGHTVLK